MNAASKAALSTTMVLRTCLVLLKSN